MGGPEVRSVPGLLSLARGQRGVAVGGENHYGSRSERGTRVAALFYSLIESTKLRGVEPRGYLREATLRAVRTPGTATLARDLDAARTRIDSVFDQFLNRRGWPLDHLAGRNTVRRSLGKPVNTRRLAHHIAVMAINIALEIMS